MKQMRFLIVFIGISLFLLIPFMIWGSLNYAGYCFPQKRFLSNHEKIEIALENLNSMSVITLPENGENGSTNFVAYKIIPYRSSAEIIKKDPKCCWVTTGGYRDIISPVTFWDQVLNIRSTNIVVDYFIKYNNKTQETVLQKTTRALSVNNCGILVHD